MITLYSASWLLPGSSTTVEQGTLAIEDEVIAGVGQRSDLLQRFPEARERDFGNAMILPGFINAHSHLELTAMRGYLENEETNFFAWLKKLTIARLERMTAEDLKDSAQWGACEAVRSGVTSFADASDSAATVMEAVGKVGARGIVFQESFGPDARLAAENFQKLKDKVDHLRTLETPLVKCGVSPHSPYTVAGNQLEMIAQLAMTESLPVMMHAAETKAEVALLLKGGGPFAEGLKSRGIEWSAPGLSPIQYLKRHGVLETHPLLAHCIYVDDADIEAIKQTQSSVAHCPKSNAKLGHGAAPLSKFLQQGIVVGLGSDSMASNNICDLLEEARFALLTARCQPNGERVDTGRMLRAMTSEGAHAVGLRNVTGELRAGLAADFTIVSLDQAQQIPSYDPLATLLFTSSGRDVVLTVVAGREVYRDGKVTTVDEDRLRARMLEIARKLNP